MKYAILVADGMADYPLKELDGRTPIEAARTENIDGITKEGQLGSAGMIPTGFAPGSDVATLSILGYDPRAYYAGRAPLEAAKLGIELGSEEIAFRCNLITVSDSLIADYSGGHIGDKEAAELILFLGQHLETPSVRFYPGVSYRHICVFKNSDLLQLNCTPPHDVLGEPAEEHMPQGREARLLIELMERSYELLSSHPINKSRVQNGLNPANMIWLWGQGSTPRMPSFRERFGVGGGIISAVDLLKGIAKLVGLDPIEVPGATGYYDTNYKGKADYALKCLERDDFVLVHVEAPDEAGHNAEMEEKIKAIENFDRFIVGPVKERLSKRPDFRILVLPDHATPLKLRTHTADPVPFAWCGQGILADEFEIFSEREAAKSSLSFRDGYQLIDRFINSQKVVK
ncbi:cofactor-independent phosphoglycerate mutase [Chloroflexota bacterium]